MNEKKQAFEYSTGFPQPVDKGNAPAPAGVDNRSVVCLKCGKRFNLRAAHTCTPREATGLDYSI